MQVKKNQSFAILGGFWPKSRNFWKKILKKLVPIIFSSFWTTGENFSQNADPHVTPMVQFLIHPLLFAWKYSLQSVGTLVLFYCTFASVGLYEAFASRPVPSIVMRASIVLLLASPVVNGFMFGLKNKVSRGNVNSSGIGSFVEGCCRGIAFPTWAEL